MGNTPLSSSDRDFTYGRTTEQINGILTLRKQTSLSKNTKQWRRGLSLPWISARGSHDKNKRVKSQLMRSILERDWQKVLIRARLFPQEIHEFMVLEVPLPISCHNEGSKCNRSSTKTATWTGKPNGTRWVSYCRVKVLPLHAACALRPPPEVVRALLSHAVGSAFSSDRMGRRGSKKVFGNPTKPTREKLPQELSSTIPLHHEHNTSFAAVAVERFEDSSIGQAIVEKLHILGDVARKASFRDNRVGKLRLLCSTTEEEDCDSSNGSGFEDNGKGHFENNKDVTLFLKQMEDHLAHNGRCQSVFRDKNPDSKSSRSSKQNRNSPRSVFVMNFDTSLLLPAPSAVRVTEKQNRKPSLNKRDDDLFSLENSIGDSDTAMTSSTNQLVRNGAIGERKQSEESSSLQYLSDESSSSGSSSLLEPPSSDSDDSDDRSSDSNSFLQLTADGKLTLVDLEVESPISSGSGKMSDDSKANMNDHDADEPMVLRSSAQSSSSKISGKTSTDIRPFSGSSFYPDLASSRPTFVPGDVRLNPSTLFQSLPKILNGRRKHGKRKYEAKRVRRKKTFSRKQDQGVYGLSRLLPLHVACLYGASAGVLKILLEEYPEGSSIEILGMLPVHMVAANWSLVATEEGSDSRYYCDASYSVEGFDSEKNRIAALVDYSPGSLSLTSSAHGLRPLEYTRILLCYPSNASDEGMIRVRNYLDLQEEKLNPRFGDCGTSERTRDTVECPKNELKKSSAIKESEDVYCNLPIETTSTCTTSALSSSWMVNDSSSVYSSSASSSVHVRQTPLASLLSQSRWKEAMSLIENNHESSKERCFTNNARDIVSGNNESFSSSSSSGLKEVLPIHMVCQILKNGSTIPIDLVRLIISSHPEGLEQTDDDSMSGSLPLHLVCDSFRRRHRYGMHNHLLVQGSCENYRAFVSVRLQALQLILGAHPDATHFTDNRGRLPLHRAVMVAAPLEAIQLLVYRYPKAIALGDREGLTPFCLAKKVYAFGSPVMELLERAWV